ncbi:MAG: competence/damage-inducible protein A [Thermotoga sp.]|nr:MAG: competence/damage-inducible protein A [Thermotoga sp.]
MNPKIGVVSVGDELLEGMILDRNSNYVARELTKIGCEIIRVVQVRDKIEEIAEVVSDLLKISNILIISGGLGPTEDDLTREGVAKALRRKLVMDEKILAKLEEKLKDHGLLCLENVKKQAEIIEGAEILENTVGTAPGQFVKHEGKMIFILPGPPVELIPMFERYVLPRVEEMIHEKYTTRIYRFIGIKEATLEEKLKDFLYSDGRIKVSTMIDTYVGPTIRLTVRNEEIWRLERMEKMIKERVGEYLYNVGDKRIDELMVERMLKEGITISIAESCTGGLVASTLVNFPGVSKIFKGGVIVYSNESKAEVLGVDRKTLEKFGAVSERTAMEMASNVREKFKSEIGIGVTGIAGPTGGTSEKPIGLVFFAIDREGQVQTRRERFHGDRNTIRMRAVYSVFDLLRKVL